MLDHKDLHAIYSSQNRKEIMYRSITKRTPTSSNKKIKEVNKSLMKYGMTPLFLDGIHKKPVC